MPDIELQTMLDSEASFVALTFQRTTWVDARESNKAEIKVHKERWQGHTQGEEASVQTQISSAEEF